MIQIESESADQVCRDGLKLGREAPGARRGDPRCLGIKATPGPVQAVGLNQHGSVGSFALGSVALSLFVHDANLSDRIAPFCHRPTLTLLAGDSARGL